MKEISKECFERCVQLGILDANGNPRSYSKSSAQGFMDLSVEKLPFLDGTIFENGQGFAMSHYFEQNGDLCSDPSMELIVDAESERVVPYSFQQSLPPVYDVVPEDKYFQSRKARSMSEFLLLWLKNLQDQGHGLSWAA